MDGTLKLPFEAVAVRYVHDVRSGEFLNIGVVLLSPAHGFAGARFLSQWGRITGAFAGADPVLLRRIARAFEERCNEWTTDEHGQLTLERVVALKSLIGSVMQPDAGAVQFSQILGGITADPARTLVDLFHVYVGASMPKEGATSRDDNDIWKAFAERNLPSTLLIKRLQRHTIRVDHYDLHFDHAWKNGTWNVAQPISLDLLDARQIRDKAAGWMGRLTTLKERLSQTNVFLLVGMPSNFRPAVREAAEDGLAILDKHIGRDAHVLTEDRGDELARKIIADLGAHEESHEEQ
jgi:hypothetical protein